MKSANRIGCGALVMLTVAIGFGGCWLVRKPGRKFEDLLRGDNQVAVASVRIYGQNQTVERRDTESMQYLTFAFRSAQKDVPVPVDIDTTYLVEMRLSPGGEP